ncbi:MAG TPA: prepilin peptidase [Acidobacteriaceae bacterium]
MGGLLLGSFLNVCISRLPEHRSIVKPRSQCTRCGQIIRWHDNIPLLSWILLRAKCRNCKAHIPPRYPAVELAVGLWFLLSTYELQYAVRYLAVREIERTVPLEEWLAALLTAIAIAILGFLLIGLLVMDWQTHTLPDAFTLTGTAIGFLLICVQAVFLPTGAEDIHLTSRSNLRMSSPGSFAARGNVFLTGTERLVFGRIAAIVGAALILLVIRWIYKAIRKREGLGLGDVKLLAMIAAFLGFWPAVLALFAGVLGAAGYAILLLVRRRADLATYLPFGSFLCAGGLLAALWGEQIITWYRSML